MARAIHVFRSPDRFVAGTVGQPGDRTFFLQAVHQARVVSVMLEKQQVQILADRIGMLLEEIHRRFGTPIPPETESVDDLNPLVMPVDAEFQVGTMGPGLGRRGAGGGHRTAGRHRRRDRREHRPRRHRGGTRCCARVPHDGRRPRLRGPLVPGDLGRATTCPICGGRRS